MGHRFQLIMAKFLNPWSQARLEEDEAFEVVTGQPLEKWSMVFFSLQDGASNPAG
jgi:hypothetical protein